MRIPIRQQFFIPAKTSNQVEAKQAIADIAIVGGGTCATSDLCAILDEAQKQDLSGFTITIFEKYDSFGAGRPWNKDQHHTLTSNDPNLGMIMFAKNPEDFANWLAANLEKLKQRFPKIANILNTNSFGPDRFVPRFIFGIYAEQRFQELLGIARKRNINVILKPHTEIIKADRTADGDWELQSEDKRVFKTKNLKLALGPLPSDTYTQLLGLPNYYHDALNEYKLKNPWISMVPPTDAVAIMGSGLTAIDCAKILIENGHTGRIYFVSPSAHLPRVKGRPDGKERTLQFLTSKNLSKDNLRITEVLDLLVKEISHASGQTIELKKMMQTAHEYGENPLLGLQKELKRITAGEVRPWWWIMGEIYFHALPIIGRHLLPADRGIFIQQIMPLYLKWMAGMTEDNARRLVKLITSGQLKVLHGPNALPKYHETTKQWQIETREQTLTADHVINATGPGRNIHLHKLLHDMAMKGHIRSHTYGSLDVTQDELRLIDKHGCTVPNAWASGQATVVCNPAAAGSIEWNARDAQRIAPQIIANIAAKRPRPVASLIRSSL